MDPIPAKKRKKFPTRLAAYTVLAAILMTLAVCALSAVLIRSMDSFLLYCGEEDFAGIFAQLEDAELDAHGIIPFLLWLVFVLCMGLLSRKIGRWTWIPALILGVFVFLLSLAAAMWFTDVNGIRFGTVLASLAELMSGPPRMIVFNY